MTSSFGYIRFTSPRIKAIDSAHPGNRLNLVYPAISYPFAASQTAIRLFEILAPQFDYSRIITTYPDQDLSTWSTWTMDPSAVCERSIAYLRSASDELPVISGDHFIATFWDNAFLVKNAIERQRQIYPNANRRYIYFIQEYDPSVYSWSYERDLARASYDDTENAIAIFNMARFRDYFLSRSISFKEQYVFEPKLHPELLKTKLENQPKERLIFVYARPNTPRNAFHLVVDSLNVWANSYAQADQWSIVTAGEKHEDIEIAKRVRVRSLGHLGMSEYGYWLSRSWAGIAFSFWPHPSFSRLDIAALGAWLITNQAPHDLSDLSPSIISIKAPTPEKVADKIAWCCNQFSPGKPAVLATTPSIYSDQVDELPLRDNILRSWLQSSSPNATT